MAERSPDPRLEGEDRLGGAVARKEADEDRPDGEGEEGVQPQCGDEHDDEKDAGGGIEEQSCVVSRHPRGPSLRPRSEDARIAQLIRFLPPELHQPIRSQSDSKHTLEYANRALCPSAIRDI